MKIRGYFALGIVCLGFLIFDLFQRVIVTLWVWLRPSARIPVLGRWIQLMADFVLGTLRLVGGAEIKSPPRIVPTGPGVLVVMNHQSLLDIPLVTQTVDGGYPRIVTRERYRRFIPLISHMVRLYQYPVVDPKAKAREVRKTLDSLAATAADSDVPIAVFPEGTRTKDGEIGRFRTRGLARILGARPWQVHVFVVDGYWKVAKFEHFAGGMHSIDGKIDYLGVLEWTDPTADSGPFIASLREMLVDGLARMREGTADRETDAVET